MAYFNSATLRERVFDAVRTSARLAGRYPDRRVKPISCSFTKTYPTLIEKRRMGMLKEPVASATPESIAARALGFLAADPERLGRFLALSGLDPSSIRVAARDPGFLPAVLDHILSDERLLLEFAEAESLKPESVARARAALGPKNEEN